MISTKLMSLAAGGAILDIDGSVFVQLFIFIVMALVATRWLFRPYLKMREDRHQGIDGAKDEAKKLSAEADAQLADYEQKLAAARSRANDEQRKIRAEAAAHQSDVTEKARAKAQTTIDVARAKVETEVEAARKELLPQAETIAQNIATKLLGRELN